MNYRYRQPGRLWTILNHFYVSLLPGLSKKSAYRLNVTLKASATGTVITKKYFALISHIAYSRKSLFTGNFYLVFCYFWRKSNPNSNTYSKTTSQVNWLRQTDCEQTDRKATISLHIFVTDFVTKWGFGLDGSGDSKNIFRIALLSQSALFAVSLLRSVVVDP